MTNNHTTHHVARLPFCFIFIVLFLFTSSSAWCVSKENTRGRVSDLIRCLGQEELALHKQKLSGPLYQLNQELIVLFAGSNELILKEGLTEEICHNKDFGPSVALLQNLFTHNYNIFFLDATQVPVRSKLSHHVIMNELKERGHLIFATYISGLQGLTNDPHCLAREIPELKYLYDRIKYLEEEIEARELVEANAKIEAVFLKLKNFKGLQKRCREFMIKQAKDQKKSKP